jgi:ketosteroid isomerase-like protein
MTDTHHPDVQRLLDRQAISDCVHRYARGLDRHDDEMIASVYFEDAVDQHGDFTGGPREFIDWANDLHERSFRGHQHHITTQTVEIDGDVAHAESYVICVLTRKGGGEISDIAGGRYLDRLECRGGEWRIAARKVIVEWAGVVDGAGALFGPSNGFPAPRWDRQDISYERPLTVA